MRIKFFQLLFLAIALLAFATPTEAQNRNNNLDTLNASETVYYYPNDAATANAAKTFPLGNLYIQIQSDSLSGATACVTDIQYACTDTPDTWVTQANGTLTSNGAASQTLIYEDASFGADKWRVRSVVTSGSAQATKISTGWSFKRD